VTLGPSQAYELVFWPSAGGSPLGTSYGPVGITKNTSVQVDLQETVANVPQINFGDYQWGVLLVETNPYRRVKHLGGAQAFRLESTSSSPNTGSSKPPEPNEPDDDASQE